jgi:AraC family transcriptional regulator
MLCDDPLGRADVSRLAREADVHPVYLARVFRRHFGQSLGTFARRRRLQWSADQLSGTDRGLAEIALEAGFADQSHFTRQFKRAFGVSPRQFRLSERERVAR